MMWLTSCQLITHPLIYCIKNSCQFWVIKLLFGFKILFLISLISLQKICNRPSQIHCLNSDGTGDLSLLRYKPDFTTSLFVINKLYFTSFLHTDDHILEWSSALDTSVIDNWKIKNPTFDVVNDVNQDFSLKHSNNKMGII
jgi:hypothetical protein